MKIYNVEIFLGNPTVKVDLRHAWLIRQAEDCMNITDSVARQERT